MIPLYLVYASFLMMLPVAFVRSAAGVFGDIALAAAPIPRPRAAFTDLFHYLFPRLTRAGALDCSSRAGCREKQILPGAFGSLVGGCGRFLYAQEFNFALLDNPRKVAENAIISAAKVWAMRLFYITSARLVQRIRARPYPPWVAIPIEEPVNRITGFGVAGYMIPQLHRQR